MKETMKAMTLEQAAIIFPIGTPVRFFPIAGDEQFEESVIRSEPWMVCGHVSIKITGRTGCVNTEHLQLID